MVHQTTMHLGTVASINVALPAMMEEFQVDVATAVWVQLAYSVALAGGTIPLGQLNALFGRRTLILAGQVADCGLMLLTFFAGTIYVVIAARFLSALVRTWPWLYLQVMSVGDYPPEQRGKVLGVTRLAHGAAIVISVPLTGWVTDHWGWRWLFVGTAVILAALTVAVWRLLPADAAAAEAEQPFELSRLDLPGSALMMVAAVGIVMSLQSFVKGQASALGVALGLVGLAALVAFFRVERRARTPILYLPLFRVRDIFVSSVQAVFLGFVNGAVLLLLPLLFIKGYGWTAAYAGGVLFFINLARPPSGLLAGWLADRYGSWRVIAPAALSILVGQLIAASLGLDPPLGLLVCSLLLMGLGEGLATTANLRQIFSAMPRAYLHLAPSTNIVLILVGATLGQAFVAAALELAGTSSAAGAANTALVSVASTVLVITSALFAAGMLLAQLVPAVVPALTRPSLEEDPAEPGVGTDRRPK